MNAPIRAVASTLLVAASLSYSDIASAQTQPSGPMFSTPASRASTGVPILSDPSGSSSNILNSPGVNAPQQRAPVQPQQAAQQPPQPQSAERQTRFGKWSVECANPAQGAKQCQIVGRTSSADEKQTILVFSLAYSPDGKAVRYQAALPLGIAVQQKVQVLVGDTFKTELSINRCTQQGCLLEGSLEEPLLRAMREGSEAKFTISTPEGGQIPISLSLEGFSGALSALSQS